MKQSIYVPVISHSVTLSGHIVHNTRQNMWKNTSFILPLHRFCDHPETSQGLSLTLNGREAKDLFINIFLNRKRLKEMAQHNCCFTDSCSIGHKTPAKCQVCVLICQTDQLQRLLAGCL